MTGTATAPSTATVEWTAPTHTGGSNITGYSVQVSVNGGSFAAVSAGTCQSSAPTSTSTSCTVTGLTSGSTYSFTVTAINANGSGTQSLASTAMTAYGSAAKLLVVTAPVAGASGAALSTQPVLWVADANDLRVTSDSSTQVAVSASGGTLGGTTTVTASAGVVTFSGLTFAGLTSTSYTLTFAETPSAGLTDATSSITPSGVGTASVLAISTPAGDTTYGTNFSPQPVIQVRDSGGNVVTSSTALVTATVKNSGGTALETASVSAVNGVATFTGLGGTSAAGTNTIEYSAASLTGTSESVVVSQKTVVVTASSASVTYGDPVPTITVASYSGFENGQSASVLTTTPTCTTAYMTTSNAGTTPSTSCSGAVAANYTFSYSSGSVTIARATPSLSWSDVTKAYGDSPYTITAPTATGVTGATLGGSFSYTSSDTSVVSISGTTATVAGAGSATVTATFTPTDTTNYVSGGTTTQVVTVNQGSQATLTVTSTSGTFGSALTLATSGGSGSGAVTYAVTAGTATGCSESAGSLTVTSAGTCIVTATKAASANYTSASSVATTVTFARASQTITFANPAPSGVTYGDTAIPVFPTASSGLTVTLTPTDSSICQVSGGGVVLLSAGACTITASQPGDTNYTAATDVVRAFTINQATQATVSVTSAATLLYGQAYTVTGSGGSGTGALAYLGGSTDYPGTAGCSVTSGGTLTYTSAGSCKVRAQRAGDTNYTSKTSSDFTVTIGAAGQVVSFTSTVPTTPLTGGTYAVAAQALSTVTGLSSGVTPTLTPSGNCTLSGSTVTFGLPGTCTLTASAAASPPNFTASVTSATQVIVIGQTNQSIVWTQSLPDVSYGSSGFAMTATTTSGRGVTYTLGSGTTNSACSVSALGAVTVLAVGTCEVMADSAAGGAYAAASPVTRAFQILVALPTAPTLTSASASSQAITVGFTAPGFTGGVSLSGYRVVATPVPSGTTVTSTACSASPCTIGGLENGTAYTVTVAAINSAGVGPASAATGSLTPATAAYAVQSLSATPGNGIVDLAWTPLTTAQLGGGGFTRYEVSYRQAGVTPTPSWTLATNALTPQSISGYQVTGLSNGISYDFQVVAITTTNASEIAGNTAQVIQYPSTVPSAPRNLTVLTASASSVTNVVVSWAAPLSDGGAVLTSPNYTVTATGSAGAAAVTCVPSAGDTFCTASNLTNGASYTFSVVVTNRMGNSPAATEVYNVPSADATLSDLVVTGSAGVVALSPSFASGTTAYTASVTNGVSSVTVTPTTTAAGASVTVNGVTVTSGTASGAVALNVGSNVLTVVVTASDPSFFETYTVTVTRAAASGGGGGSSSPTDRSGEVRVPIIPPTTVLAGSQTGAVTVDGQVETGVVLVRNATDSGWNAVSADFTMSVRMETRSGAPEPLTPSGVMQVPQGGFVVVSGTDYLPGSDMTVFAVPRNSGAAGFGASLVTTRVAARAAAGAVYIGSAAVNASGAVSATFAVSSNLDLGAYVLQINGLTPTDQVRSVNLLMDVVAGAPSMRSGVIREAAFYDGGSAKFSAAGRAKLRAMVSSIPAGAEQVQVFVVGVATSAPTVDENLDLARDRAKRIASYLQAQGVAGEYTVSVSTTFTVEGKERTVVLDGTGKVVPVAGSDGTGVKTVGLDQPMKSSSGKPLTTASVIFEAPAS